MVWRHVAKRRQSLATKTCDVAMENTQDWFCAQLGGEQRISFAKFAQEEPNRLRNKGFAYYGSAHALMTAFGTVFTPHRSNFNCLTSSK